MRGVSEWETHTVSRSTSIEQTDIRILRDDVEMLWERLKQNADDKRE